LTVGAIVAALLLVLSGRARRHKASIKSVDIHLRMYEIDLVTHPPSARR
jgi:hypothetical protein